MSQITESFCYHTERNLKGILYWKDQPQPPKACLLYFHGGGLLYGVKEDLPSSHIETLLNAGYAIFAFDYRLAPNTKLPDIVDDVSLAICWYLKHGKDFFEDLPPYFLWGRSAGAYLCLLAGLQSYTIPPAGILSYYGYGFVTDTWYETPNSYYLQFPRLEESSMEHLIGTKPITSATLESRYSLYLYARQTGKWISYLYYGDRMNFINLFTLNGKKDFSNYPKTLLAHSIHDPDVPYEESKILASIIPQNDIYLSFSNTHDFDRDANSQDTKRLLNHSIQFLETTISN